MQQQVYIQLHVALKQMHILSSLKLCLKQVFDAHQSTSSRHLDMATSAFNCKHADLVT